MSDRVLRHPNGGAAKIGLGVHVSSDSYCDRESLLSGTTHILEQCSVRSAVVESSYLFSSVVTHSGVRGSVCSKSTVRGVFLEGVVLDHVSASTAWLGDLVLREVVAENCELLGKWRLEGNARIHEGVWHRSPRFLRITGENQVDFGLTECKPGYAMLGCWCKPITELLKAGPRLGRKHGWTSEQIRAAKEFYEELGDIRPGGVSA